jgi:hypothetical protein
MANPMRINSALVLAAQREGQLQKRSVPKQIEYWAELGRVVERIIDLKDIFAVMQGLKHVKLESASSVAINPDDVFHALEKTKKTKKLTEKLTSAPIYYEASKSKPGFLDKVDVKTGKRETGRFQNGEFKAYE